MADKQDFGIKISQPGFSATNAPDYNLAFSSSWPQMSIVVDYVTTITATLVSGTWTYPAVTVQHNLGFYAFTRAYVSGGNFETGIISNNFTVPDNDNLYIQDNQTQWLPSVTPTSGTTITVNIKIYNINLLKFVTYPYKQPPIIAQPYDKDYGIKIVKENKSIDSNDLRDFILHSRAQSPQIDSVNVDPSFAQYTNTTGYINWVFGFGFNTNAPNLNLSAVIAPPDGAQALPWMRINRDGSFNFKPNFYSVSNFAAGGGAASLVVIRDPLFVAQNIEVTI